MCAILFVSLFSLLHRDFLPGPVVSSLLLPTSLSPFLHRSSLSKRLFPSTSFRSDCFSVSILSKPRKSSLLFPPLSSIEREEKHSLSAQQDLSACFCQKEKRT